ncbi:hypothetical protein MML48_6g00002560 [Holotrichia oblita]|uniref:Uncharacterized protein n=1 Tax=Holotrichia oblita TaxID=644536 RepID=A0ACB9SXR4_HOLOL|nr:hypothetical protein MML48_6g00002560 [Holotrichia oblita]
MLFYSIPRIAHRQFIIFGDSIKQKITNMQEEETKINVKIDLLRQECEEKDLDQELDNVSKCLDNLKEVLVNENEVDYNNQIENKQLEKECETSISNIEINNNTNLNTLHPSNSYQNEREVVTQQEKEDIQEPRTSAKQSLEKQAEKMLVLSSVKYPAAANIGNSVVVKIPDVDRAKSDARNAIAVIMSLEEEGMYRPGTEHGILDQPYARNQFTICKEIFISINEVPEVFYH